MRAYARQPQVDHQLLFTQNSGVSVKDYSVNIRLDIIGRTFGGAFCQRQRHVYTCSSRTLSDTPALFSCTSNDSHRQWCLGISAAASVSDVLARSDRLEPSTRLVQDSY
jgi:hypothetical protein